MSAIARGGRARGRERAATDRGSLESSPHGVAPDATICVFAKPPRPGLVKTRLAEAIGQRRAAELAQAFVVDSWEAVSRVPWARAIVASTAADPALPGEVWLQGDGELGARIERVLRRALATTPCAIAIGADSPGLPPHLLDRAREVLAHHDAVIGPATDGGFYLLGLRSCPPDLLAHIPWSTQHTCARTIAALRAHGMTVAPLPLWFDVDRSEDLERLQRLIASRAIDAPATAEILTSWATRQL